MHHSCRYPSLDVDCIILADTLHQMLPAAVPLCELHLLKCKAYCTCLSKYAHTDSDSAALAATCASVAAAAQGRPKETKVVAPAHDCKW